MRSIAIAMVLFAPGLAGAQTAFRLAPQTGHSKDIRSLALSADGTMAATGSEDHRVALWDLRSGKRIRSYVHSDQIRDVAFSRDGSSLVASDNDNNVIAWSSSSGERLWDGNLKLGFYHSTLDLPLSDDASRFAYSVYGANDPRLAIVEHRQTGKRVMLRDHPARISRVAMSGDGKRVLTGTEKGHIFLWDADTGARLRRVDSQLASVRQGASISKLAFVRGTNLAISAHLPGYGEAEIYVWNLDDPRDVRAAKLPGRYVYAARADKAGDRLDVWVATKAEDDKSELLLVSYALSSLELRRPAGATGDRRRRGWLARLRLETFDDVEVALAESAPRTVVVLEDRARVYDTRSGEPLLDFPVRRAAGVARTEAVALSPKGDVALLARGNAVVRLDLATMESRRFLDRGASQLAWCSDGTVAVAGDKLAIYGRGGQLRIEVEAGRVAALEFSADCSKLVSAEGMGLRQSTPTVVVRDAISGEVLRQHRIAPRLFIESMGHVNLLRERADRHVLLDNAERVLAVFETDLDRVGATATATNGNFEARRESLEYIVLTRPTGQTMRLRGWEGVAAVALDRSGDVLAHGSGSRELWRFPASGPATRRVAGAGSPLAFAPGAEQAIASTRAGLIVWRLDTGAVVGRHDDHAGQILDVAVSADGKRILSTAEDGTLVLWDVAREQRLSIALLGGEWIAYTPDGYFTSSGGGVELAAVVKGNRAFGVEQFAAQYNRPDRILERMGLGTRAQIRGLARRVKARERKLGSGYKPLDGKLAAPEARIVSVRRDGKRAELVLELEDAVFGLESYMVYVNGTPALPRRAALSGKRARARSSIELTRGVNRIEVSAISRAGVESARDLRVVRYNRPTPRDLYFVGFGVSRYADPSLNLEMAHKDAGDLARVFWAQRGDTYRNAYVTTFQNHEVTPAALDEARRFIAHAGVDDTVVLFIAGHGVLDPETGTYYYLSHGARLDALAKTAITFDRIEKLLYATSARSKLFLMDTCDSGELDERAAARVEAAAGARGLRSRGLRRLREHARPAKGTPPVPRSDRDRFLYRDVLRRSGAVVISSSRGGEYSYESKELGNGLFTFEVIRALSTAAADSDGDGQVTQIEIRDFVVAAVTERSGDLQHPTVDRDNLHAQVAFSVVEVPPLARRRARSLPPPVRRARTGCCNVGGSPSGSVALALLVLVALAPRRRRR